MYGDWDKFSRHIATLDMRLEKRIRRITMQAAHYLSRDWKLGIKTKSFGLKENTPLTIEAKGSSTPLVDHGDLLGAIKPHKIDFAGDTWFVGILKNAKTSDGEDLVDIANVLEHGSDGPIRAKKKWLAIPLTKAASRAGSPLNFPEELIYIEPQDWSEPVAYFVTGNRNGLTFHYILLQKVVIPPRPSKQEATKEFGPRLQHMYAEGIADEVRGKHV